MTAVEEQANDGGNDGGSAYCNGVSSYTIFDFFFF